MEDLDGMFCFYVNNKGRECVIFTSQKGLILGQYALIVGAVIWYTGGTEILDDISNIDLGDKITDWSGIELKICWCFIESNIELKIYRWVL